METPPFWVEPFVNEIENLDPGWQALHERLVSPHHWLDVELWLSILGVSLLITVIRLLLTNYVLYVIFSLPLSLCSSSQQRIDTKAMITAGCQKNQSSSRRSSKVC